MADRRSFLKMFAKGATVAGVLAVLPGPLKLVAIRLGLPASAVVRVGGLSMSTRALRASWPAIAAVTARAAAARAWVIAAGGTAAAALKAFVSRHKVLPTWYNPVFRPSLRNILDGSVR